MPIFEKPPLETLTPAKDRWTPIYLEHGRLEVDDSSIKWIGAECLRFYAFGITPNHTNDMPRKHAALWADKKKRAEIARRMFALRFGGVEVQAHSIAELRGMEGLRVRTKYAELGQLFGVTWKGRDYDPSSWNLADNINRALSAANASLYAVCAAVCCSLGYLPALGFIHDSGTLPFIYDVADLYKESTSFPAAFQAIHQQPMDNGDLTRALLKERIEQGKLLQRIPKDLEALIQ